MQSLFPILLSFPDAIADFSVAIVSSVITAAVMNAKQKQNDKADKPALDPAPKPPVLEVADVPANLVKQIEERAFARLRDEEAKRQQEEDERLQQEMNAHNLDYERSVRVYNEQRHRLYLKRLGRFQAYAMRDTGWEVTIDEGMSVVTILNNTGVDLARVTIGAVNETAEHGSYQECSDIPSLPSGFPLRSSCHGGFHEVDHIVIIGWVAETGEMFSEQIPLDPNLTMYEFREDSGDQYGTCC